VDINPQATVIVIANILPHSFRIVPLQQRPVEPSWICFCHAQPESLGGLDVGRFVNVDAKVHLVGFDSGRIQKPQEETDHPGIGIDE
jgi:hypothetical protein